MMMRREFVGVGTAGLISCGHAAGHYFGTTVPPSTRRLVHTLGGELSSLDPADSPGAWEFYVIPALFTGLSQCHPQHPEPMAALATHYEASPDQDQFTFYLRGHPAPRGIRLTDSGSLPFEFTHGRKASPDSTPALWSDGTRITAHDFVYSWRRFVDPNTAAPQANLLFDYVVNAEDINNRKRQPNELGVRALDDFTFQVDLRRPTSFFLHLITQYIFAAVPRQAIEAARRRGDESSWTEPRHIVVNGPFTLRNWRRYEALTTVRNPRYYDAHMVGLDELTFLPLPDGTAAVNLYRSGVVAATPGFSFPPVFTPAVERMRDFHADPAFGTVTAVMNILKPPLDSVLLRYALNMGTEKRPVTDVLRAGRVAASSLVSPIPGYPSLTSFNVSIDGRDYDVLSQNVPAARALLAKAGLGPGRTPEIDFHLPALPDTRLKAQILQQQWKHNLGIRVNLVVRELSVHFKMVMEGDYGGAADYAFLPTYYDPNAYFDLLPSGATPADTVYRSMLDDANRTLNPRERFAKLASCEQRLFQAMPVVPLCHEVLTRLRKPFVSGLSRNPFDIPAFQYAHVDNNWKPA